MRFAGVKSLLPWTSGDDHFEVVTDIGAFKALESAWDDLCGRARRVRFSQSFVWCWTSWEAVEGPQGGWVHCVVARNRERVVLIWPFVLYRKSHLLVATPLGCAYTEYPDPLVEDGHDAGRRLEGAWKTLCGTCGCDMIEFRFVRTGSLLDRFLIGKVGKRSNIPYRLVNHSVSLHDYGTWEDYCRSLQSKNRRENRRSLRRLEERGNVALEVVEGARCEPIIEWALANKVEQFARANRRAGSWLETNAYRNLLIWAAKRPSPYGRMVMFVLKFDDRIIATLLCRVDKFRIEALNTVYDADYKGYAPGKILFGAVIEWAFKRGLDFDMRVGDEDYKKEWADHQSTVLTYEVPISAWYRLCRRYPSLAPRLRRYRLKSIERQQSLSYQRELSRAKRDLRMRRNGARSAAGDYPTFSTFSATRWNALARVSTQRHCWARACLETINADDEPWPITFGDALAPFVFKRGHPHRLAFMGDFIPEPYDVMAGGDSVDGLAEAIAETGMPLHLKRIPEDAAIIDALKRAYRDRGFVTVKPDRWGCPYVELDESWCDPERHFSKKKRWSFRNGRRMAENLGPVTFDVVASNTANLDALLTEAFKVEASGWKRRAGSAIAVSSWRRAFYRRLARYAAEEGVLRLCFLRIGGKAVAMELAVECDGRFFSHKIGYDDSFASCSPGSLLRLEILRYGAERGMRSYEFQGMDDPWTYEWTRSVRRMVAVSAHPVTARRFWTL